MIEQLDEMSIIIAVHTHCTPAAADDIPIVDALSQMTLIRQEREDRAKFEAALHGMQLR